LKTGCKTIDNLLHGGLFSSQLTEIYGESNSGKTRLCLNIAANLLVSLKPTLTIQEQINNKSNNNNVFRILYIDSCNNFCPKLFAKILKALDQSLTDEQINELLKMMRIMYCENIFDLLDILFTLEKESKLLGCKTVTHLLIIESFNILFNIFKNSYNELLSNLHYTTRILKYLCDYLNITILVVNSTSAERYKLHQTWNSLPNVRILLTKANNEHKIELIKHTRVISNSFCKFQITENGLM
jgi:archaellum biogenesis ATPase FlaH